MSQPLVRPRDGEARTTPGTPQAGVRDERLLVAARREHALQSLLELGHELTVVLGVHETADLLLFNLMGQLRTARSAVWLYPDDDEATAPVLVRTHGFPRPLLDAIGSACGPAFAARFRDDGFPTLAWWLLSSLVLA